ncbi:MAG: tryptophan-rich sensory protein [Bacilli bacterium]
MILCFYGIDRKAGLYQIPYFLWLLFATILNFSVYFLNR